MGEARNSKITSASILGNGSREPADERIAYRRGAAKLHPDAGGDPEEFRRLQEARDVLLGGGS